MPTPTLQAFTPQWLRDRDNSDLPWGVKLPDGREVGVAAVYPDGSPTGQFALTQSQVNAARQSPVVAAPWRVGMVGDSRALYAAGGTQIGVSGTSTTHNPSRVGPWIAAYCGDVELFNFGVAGDTMISASTSTGWNGVARSDSKTFANLVALAPDAVVIEFGINDLPGATSAALIAEAKSMVSAFVSTGTKVVLGDIMLFDPTAAAANISPANAAATLVKINEFTSAMSAFMQGLTGRAVFVAANNLIALASTGYGDPQCFQADNLGVHTNKRGAQLRGRALAAGVRSLLPQRYARSFTSGPLYQPNLVDWGAAASSNLFVTNSITGTTTATTPIWGVDLSDPTSPLYGVPYAETTITPTVLASGTAQAFFKICATNIQGASPKFPIAIGDMFQASGHIVVDDGRGGTAAVQSVYMRMRMFNTGFASQFFADVGGAAGSADLTTLPLPLAGRFMTPSVPTPIASVDIGVPAAGTGSSCSVGFFIEMPALQAYRVRVYAPTIRVVSRPVPTSVTAGTSPYIWQNNPQPFVLGDYVNSTGRDAMVTVAPGVGGTISQIAIGRGGTVAGVFPNAVNTGLTSGVFVLKPGDGLVVTWAVVAAVLTVSPT